MVFNSIYLTLIFRVVGSWVLVQSLQNKILELSPSFDDVMVRVKRLNLYATRCLLVCTLIYTSNAVVTYFVLA